MKQIMKLVEEFDEYTKKLVGQLYYEGNLKNKKDIKKALDKGLFNVKSYNNN